MRALASQVMRSAKSRHSSREHSSAARQASRKSSSRRPTGASPITSRGAAAGKRRDRHAARQRLQQHQTERVGAAREHEHIGRGVNLAPVPRHAASRETPHRDTPFANCARAGPSPTTSFVPGRSSLRKASTFFSTASRPTVRKIGRGNSSVRARARPEQICIDAARPQLHVLEAARLKFAASAGVAASTAAPAL